MQWEEFDLERAHYLSLEDQQGLFPELSALIGENTYARKNLGYLFALAHGADKIWDTDDDTFFRGVENTLTNSLLHGQRFIAQKSKFVNPYNHFAPDSQLWPRGLPMQYILSKPQVFFQSNSSSNYDVVQTLVNREPDVDAIYRMTRGDHLIDYPVSSDVLEIEVGTWVPGNTQSTLWQNKNIFHYLYLPSTTSFRFTDILKFYVAQIQCRVAYAGFLTEQFRNPHDYFEDFKSEIQCYLNSESVVDLFISAAPKDIVSAYDLLVENAICLPKEKEILEIFLTEINRIRSTRNV